MKLLVVEPDKEIASLIIMFCQLSNVAATNVETFQEAFELVRAADFDGFILDIPNCENYVFEDIYKLRRFGERPKIKQRFVGTTASVIPSNCAQALLHLDCLYSKPMSLQLLLEAVFGTQLACVSSTAC